MTAPRQTRHQPDSQPKHAGPLKVGTGTDTTMVRSVGREELAKLRAEGRADTAQARVEGRSDAA